MTTSCDALAAKWNCEYCTYENWPSSVRCTMCRGKKPAFGEDIYRLRDESPSILGGLASGPSSQRDTRPKASSNGKWECSACTYLNWPRAMKCNECRTPRASSNELNLHEQLKPLSISNDMATVTSSSASATSPLETMIEYKESENDLRDRRSTMKTQGGKEYTYIQG